MVLFQTRSLKSLQTFESMSMSEVIELCWDQNKLFSILSPASFRRCSPADLHTVEYETINYTIDTKWRTLTDSIFGVNGVQSEYVFLDAFCVNQARATLEKRKNDLEARSHIFENSKKHHVVEASCLLNCETWHDLSCINRAIRPILHNSHSDQEANNILIRTLRSRGFDCTQVIEPDDVTIKNTIREHIIRKWESVESFNIRLQDTIIKALELSQV